MEKSIQELCVAGYKDIRTKIIMPIYECCSNYSVFDSVIADGSYLKFVRRKSGELVLYLEQVIQIESQDLGRFAKKLKIEFSDGIIVTVEARR